MSWYASKFATMPQANSAKAEHKVKCDMFYLSQYIRHMKHVLKALNALLIIIIKNNILSPI